MRVAASVLMCLLMGASPLTAQSTDALAVPNANAAPPGQTFSRDQVAAEIADDQKIVSPHGVQKLVEIDVRGTKQWISIRGKDTSNPILLFLHGGPGYAEMPNSWTYETPWEDYFTVVQWDQRGTGKTFEANDPKAVADGMTIEGMTADAAEVVRYLERTYGKKKVFVMGHSWGSILGVRLAQEHPEMLYAYVGVGQVVSGERNEKDGYAFALEQAKATHNEEAVKELESLAPWPPVDMAKATPQNLFNERKWVSYFGGMAYGRTSMNFEAVSQFSPEYSQKDLDAADAGMMYSVGHLLPELATLDFTKVVDFRCPVILLEGRHDYTVSHVAAAEWFATVKAPQKKLVWFNDAAHLVMEEEPGKVLYALVKDVRPIAVEAGDGAPAN
jgi:pimeloyl-ACP methyl ester carboxylesterase